MAAFLITGCNPSEEDKTVIKAGEEPSIKVESITASASGDKIVWNVSINSKYENTNLVVGAFNYATTVASYTRSYCNNGVQQCSDVKYVECDLLSRSGSYIDYSCKFVYSDGTFSNGDVESISMPYTTTINGKTKNVTMDVVMDVRSVYHYVDRNSDLYDVNDNKLVPYQNY